MRVPWEHLDSHLEGGLAALYVVHGDEMLLVNEAADRVRAAARRAGFTERVVLEGSERGFLWGALRDAAHSLSLFGSRTFIDLRLPGGRPGVDGAKALDEHARAPCEDVLTLVTLPRPDGDAQRSPWLASLRKSGREVAVPSVDRPRLPDWIAARLARQGQSADRVTLEFIAERVEGNLLAAHQEIQKLGLLFGAGALEGARVQEAVLDVSRFDRDQLRGAIAAGQGARAVRVLEALRAEGVPLPLVQWTIAEELRALWRAAAMPRTGMSDARQASAARLGPRPIAAALRRAAELDKIGKGLRGRDTLGEPWTEWARLCLRLTARAAKGTGPSH